MLASAVVFGVLAGWLTGGHPRRLADLEIAWWPALVVALALRFAAPAIGDSLAIWSVSFLVIAAVAVLNRAIPGMWLIAAGAALNLFIVALNQGMPVDPGAVAIAHAKIPSDGLHRELREGDVLAIFADRIPVPIVAGVYSVGDVLLAAGGSWVPFARMRRS